MINDNKPIYTKILTRNKLYFLNYTKKMVVSLFDNINFVENSHSTEISRNLSIFKESIRKLNDSIIRYGQRGHRSGYKIVHAIHGFACMLMRTFF